MEAKGIKKSEFSVAIEGWNYSDLTKKQYLGYERILKEEARKYGVKGINQQLINLFFAKYKGKRNPARTGFIKAFLRCHDPNNDLRIIVPKDMSRSKSQLKQYKFLEQDQMDTIINNLKDPQLKVMAKIYSQTGLRKMELGNLKYSDIDFKTLTIRGIGKFGKPFEVPISKRIALWINKYVSMKACKDKEHPFVFFKSDGKPYKDQRWAIWYKMRKACEKDAKIPKVFIHQFRHYLGHHLKSDLGWDLEDIRATLRHSNLETTRIYAPATTQEIRRKLNEEVFKE